MLDVKSTVGNLIAEHGTRNPEILAGELGISILKKPFKNTMGFFKRSFGEKFIVVNSNLDEATQVIVLAHELGHAILHSDNISEDLHNYSLMPRGKVENEANKFAAELLINEEDIENYNLKDLTMGQLASYYGVPKKLIEYKFTSLEN